MVGGRLKVVFLPNYNVSLARGDHPRRRSVGADFDRRHGSLRHRQHEARAQRRADHRHARRRQHRNPRAGRRRQHLHLRPDGGRGRAAAAGALHRAATRQRSRRGWPRRSRCIRERRVLARRAGPLPVRSSRRCSATTTSWWRPISTPIGRRSARSTRCTASRGWWRASHPQHRADGLVFVGPRHPRICGRNLGRDHRSRRSGTEDNSCKRFSSARPTST